MVMRMVFNVKLSGLGAFLSAPADAHGMAAIFSVVEMPLSQLHEEAALLHVATPSVQPCMGSSASSRGGRLSKSASKSMLLPAGLMNLTHRISLLACRTF